MRPSTFGGVAPLVLTTLLGGFGVGVIVGDFIRLFLTGEGVFGGTICVWNFVPAVWKNKTCRNVLDENIQNRTVCRPTCEYNVPLSKCSYSQTRHIPVGLLLLRQRPSFYATFLAPDAYCQTPRIHQRLFYRLHRRQFPPLRLPLLLLQLPLPQLLLQRGCRCLHHRHPPEGCNEHISD